MRSLFLCLEFATRFVGGGRSEDRRLPRGPHIRTDPGHCGPQPHLESSGNQRPCEQERIFLNCQRSGGDKAG